jgi:hypothetical protein
MVNPSKNKGTSCESAVVKFARANGFPWAERMALTGAKDCGDVRLTPLGWTAGLIVIEVKAHKSAGTGQPGPAQLTEWMAQAEAERLNAGAAHCPLVVKRTGTADVGMYFAYVPAWSVAQLMEGHVVGLPNLSEPVCMVVAVLVQLLRRAGYGDPLEAAS